MRLGKDVPLTLGAPEAGPATPGTHKFGRRAMGSPLSLTIVAPETVGRHGSPTDDGGEAAERAWRLVSDEFEAAEQAMSRFRDSSDLTRVNRAASSGVRVVVDRRLVRALAAADRAGRLTEGRFDARVLTDLERLGYHGTDLGSDPDPAPGTVVGGTASGRDGWLDADPRGSAVAIDRPVDLGGIGKGLTLRWAWRLLERAGVLAPGGGALLDAGGDLVAGGSAPQGGPWIVDIEDPRGGSVPVAVVSVPAGAVATSSVLVNHWTATDGRPVHHLIDPRTGEPGGSGLLSVTVAGPDPVWAEVWAKSLFLYGAAGIAEAARGRGLAAWWVHEDGRLEMTAGGRARTMWVAAEA
jgi:FAD:protein FMN transferase